MLGLIHGKKGECSYRSRVDIDNQVSLIKLNNLHKAQVVITLGLKVI